MVVPRKVAIKWPCIHRFLTNIEMTSVFTNYKLVVQVQELNRAIDELKRFV